MTVDFKTDWVVEPCNVTIINCITNIRIGNLPGYSCSGKSDTLIEDTVTLKGNIKLSAGFNCTITEKDNTFTVSSLAGNGACLTEPYCTGNLLGINNDCSACNETIKAINGISNKTINIQGGPGVTVSCEDKHTLLLALNTQQFKNGCNNDKENPS